MSGNIQFERFRGGLSKALKPLNKITMTARLVAKDRTGLERQVLDAMSQETFERFLKEFADTQVRDLMYRMFWGIGSGSGPGAKVTSFYMPKILRSSSDNFNRARKEWTRSPLTERYRDKWRAGFSTLFRNMTKSRTSSSAIAGGSSVGVGPMAELMEQKLSDYSMLSGRSSPTKFNSFFMAAELGTGRYADPVNHASNKESDGSWWVRGKGGHGAHFAGQQGIHFMFQKGTHTPHPVYQELILHEMMPALDEFLTREFPKGNIRRK
jgi:hypothetical protein